MEEHLRIGRKCGVNGHLKGPWLVAGMIGGAGSIGDMGPLRPGAMPALWRVRAPSALGFVPALVVLGGVWRAVEMTGRLGYDKRDPAGRGSGWCGGRP